ncbi:D-2-hydroxyacid dehydrogenase [Magnetococcales bacterium HHB-1]
MIKDYPTVAIYHPQYADALQQIMKKKAPEIPTVAASNEALWHKKGLNEAEILLGWKLPETILIPPLMKWIQSFGAGIDHFIHRPSVQSGETQLTRITYLFNDSMRQYVLAHILYDLQHLQQTIRQNQEALWKPFTPNLLKEKTLGLVGLGVIGQAIAKTMQQFQMPILGWSRSRREGLWQSMETLEALLNRADFIVLTLPDTPQTKGLFTLKQFQRIKPEACLINIGRGTVINEEDLLVALNRGYLRKCVLDVFAEEPLPLTHPFWHHEKVVVTPHISGLSHLEEVVPFFIENYKRYQRRQTLQGLVDPALGY